MSELNLVAATSIRIFEMRPDIQAIAIRDRSGKYHIVDRGPLHKAQLFQEEPGDLFDLIDLEHHTVSQASTHPRLNPRLAGMRGMFVSEAGPSRIPSRPTFIPPAAGPFGPRVPDSIFNSMMNQLMASQEMKKDPVPASLIRGLQERKLTDEETKKFTDEKTTCSVCLEGFEVSQNVMTLDCGHTFHSSCILNWFDQKNYCPLCKHKVGQPVKPAIKKVKKKKEDGKEEEKKERVPVLQRMARRRNLDRPDLPVITTSSDDDLETPSAPNVEVTPHPPLNEARASGDTPRRKSESPDEDE